MAIVPKMKLCNLSAFLITSMVLLLDFQNCHLQLMIDPAPLCLKTGTTLNLTCRVNGDSVYQDTENSSTELHNWTLNWSHDGKTLISATLSSQGSAAELVNRITVSTTGEFTCSWRSQNRSVIVGTAPKPIYKLKGMPYYTAIGKFAQLKRVIGITYPCSNSKEYNFTLVYWWRDNEASSNLTCDSTTCSCRLYFIGSKFRNLSFRIVSRSGECEAESPVWTFFVTGVRLNTKGKLLIFTPPAPNHLFINTARHKVTLTWDDEAGPYYEYSGYSYQYNSSQRPVKEKTISIEDYKETRKILLTDADIHPYKPYKKYTFCIQLQWYNQGHYSDPRCNTTRLHEDIPSAAPTITCTSETCPTIDDGDVRNVTIVWDPPSEETRNGVLTEFKVVYYSTSYDSKQMEVSVRNTSVRSIVLSGLRSREYYVVSVQACTKIGCSKSSNILKILAHSPKVSSSSSSSDIYVILGCVVGVALTIFLFAGFSYQLCRCRFNSVHETELPRIYEPQDYEYCQTHSESKYADDLCPTAHQIDNNANFQDDFL